MDTIFFKFGDLILFECSPNLYDRGVLIRRVLEKGLAKCFHYAHGVIFFNNQSKMLFVERCKTGQRHYCTQKLLLISSPLDCFVLNEAHFEPEVFDQKGGNSSSA